MIELPDIPKTPLSLTLPSLLQRTLTFLQLVTRRRMALVGLLLITFFTLVALMAPLLATRDPLELDIYDRLQPPSLKYWLGTDPSGRDLYSRLIWGSRISLLVALSSVTFGTIVGLMMGLIAGYRGGNFDVVVTMLVDGMMAFPMLLLALALVALLGPSLPNLIIAVGFSTIPRTTRLVRGEVLSIRALEYVEAARSIGATDLRIAFKHILPNILSPVLVLFSQRLSSAILTESALSYLGLGVQAPRPSWGNIIAEGQGYLETGPWVALIPGAVIALTVLGFNLLGDGLRDALDPVLRSSPY